MHFFLASGPLQAGTEPGREGGESRQYIAHMFHVSIIGRRGGKIKRHLGDGLGRECLRLWKVVA